jgi:Flp pilus assembly protein TadD
MQSGMMRVGIALWLALALAVGLCAAEWNGPTDPRYDPLDAQGQLAVQAIHQHKEGRALSFLRQQVGRGEMDPNVRALLALALLRTGEYREGLAIAEGIPSSALRRHGVVSALAAGRLVIEAEDSLRTSHAGSKRSAFILLRQAERLDPENWHLRKTLAWLYLTEGRNPSAAYAQLKVAAAWRPDDLAIKKLVGLSLSGMGQFERAAKIYREILSAEPENSWIQVSFAEALSQLGDDDQAANVCSHVLQREPWNTSAVLVLAEIAFRRGNRRGAESLVRHFLKQNPGEPSAHALLGEFYRWDRDFRRAAAEYSIALDANKGHELALAGLREISVAHAPQVFVNHYQFVDSFAFRTSVDDYSTRVLVGDRLLFSASVADWRFSQRVAGGNERLDFGLGLGYQFGRRLETEAKLITYAYSGDEARNSYGLSAKWSPTPASTLHFGYEYRLPVTPENIAATRMDLSQNSYAAGFELGITKLTSAQVTCGLDHYSDRNERRSVALQTSYLFRRRGQMFARFRYEGLSFRRTSHLYFSPGQFQVCRPLIETSYTLFHPLLVTAQIQAPYVLGTDRLGRALTLGPRIALREWFHIEGFFTYQQIPVATPWSGRGFGVRGWLRF